MSDNYKDDPNWQLAKHMYNVMLQAIRQDRPVDFLFSIIERVYNTLYEENISIEEVINLAADENNIRRLKAL